VRSSIGQKIRAIRIKRQATIRLFWEGDDYPSLAKRVQSVLGQKGGKKMLIAASLGGRDLLNEIQKQGGITIRHELARSREIAALGYAVHLGCSRSSMGRFSIRICWAQKGSYGILS